MAILAVTSAARPSDTRASPGETGRRDVRTLTQHIGLGDAIMTRHGAGLVGIDVTL